jgi:hypothetical protein
MTTVPFEFPGEPIHSFGWAGTRFDAVVVPNTQEIERRASVGLTPIVDVPLLRACGSLPAGIEVRWEDLDPIVAAVLDCAPDGVVDRSSRSVRRVLAAPLSLVGVYLVTRSWRALGRIGFMASAAPTGVICLRRPRDLEAARHTARRSGLGLGIRTAGRDCVLVAPRNRARPSVVRDLLVERLFAAWLQTDTPRARVQAVSCGDSLCTE